MISELRSLYDIHVLKYIQSFKYLNSPESSVTMCFQKIIPFFAAPAKAFEAERREPLVETLKYGACGLAVLGVLSSVVSTFVLKALTGANPLVTFLFLFLITLVGGFLGLVFYSLWLHLWTYLLGGREDFEHTVKTVFYSATPVYYLGWIPFVSIVGLVWFFVLQAIGLMKLQKLSTGSAILAVLASVLLPLALMGVMMLGALMGLSTLRPV